MRLTPRLSCALLWIAATGLLGCYPDGPLFFASYDFAPSSAHRGGGPLTINGSQLDVDGIQLRWSHTQHALVGRIFNGSGQIVTIACPSGALVGPEGDRHPLQCVKGEVNGEIDQSRLERSSFVVSPGDDVTISFLPADHVQDWVGGRKRLRSLLPSMPHDNACCMTTDPLEVEAVRRRHEADALTLVIPIRRGADTPDPLEVTFRVAGSRVQRFPF